MESHKMQGNKNQQQQQQQEEIKEIGQPTMWQHKNEEFARAR